MIAGLSSVGTYVKTQALSFPVPTMEWVDMNPTNDVNVSNFVSMAYGDGVYLAVTSTMGYYGTDGSTWTSFAITRRFSASLVHVIYANGIFVVTSLYSTNVLSWTGSGFTAGGQGNNPNNNPARALIASVYGNGLWVCLMRDSRSVLRSTDNGATWVSSSMTPDDNRHHGIAFVNNIFIVASTSLNRIFTSVDGYNWSFVSVPFSISPGIVIPIVYGNGKYVIGLSNGRTLISTDAITWHPRTTFPFSSTVQLTGIAFNGQFFVATGDTTAPVGYSYISIDAIHWTEVPIHSNHQSKELRFCEYLNGRVWTNHLKEADPAV